MGFTLLEMTKLGCQGLKGTNTLANYKHSYFMDMKSFVTLAPGCLVIGQTACGIDDKDYKL
jgi:hypothetical protein